VYVGDLTGLGGAVRFRFRPTNSGEKIMKASNKLLSVLAILAGLVFLTSCTQWRIVKNSVGDVIKPTIKLKIEDGALNFVSQDKATCNNGPGCISVGQWNIALITFKLMESSGWHFTKFEICTGSTEADLIDCSLNKWAQKEVFATDKKVSRFEFPNEGGEIDLELLATDLTKFYLFNYNAVEETYFYRITACPGDDGECSTFDPPIENGGRR
jgi:hypothetical protein